jgi:type IV secretion system protein VirB2
MSKMKLQNGNAEQVAQRAILVALMLGATANTAFAGGDLTPVQTTLDQIIELFTGTLGTALAVLAVIACGVLAWAGRLTWFVAGSIIMGIVLVFGSANIVEFFKSAAGG